MSVHSFICIECASRFSYSAEYTRRNEGIEISKSLAVFHICWRAHSLVCIECASLTEENEKSRLRASRQFLRRATPTNRMTYASIRVMYRV